MDRIGDNNKSVKENAEHLAMVLSTHPIGGTGFIINHITKAHNEKKKTATSTKHHIGRLKLLNSVLEQGNISP
jgi:hypothetical protein